MWSFLSEFVWIVTWTNYFYRCQVRTDSGYIPNNTHLSFLTRAMFGKSPNNIPFVLKRKFTLSTRRSSLSVFAPKKYETDSPSAYRSHPCYSNWDTKRRSTHISSCLGLSFVSFVVVLVPWKKQPASRDDADVYPSNILVRMLSSSSSKNIQSKSG